MRKRNSVYLFEYATMDLVEDFAKKHGLEFDGFVRDDPTGVAGFGDYIFNIDEIYYDLKTGQPKGRIEDYYDFYIEMDYANHFLAEEDKKVIPNYESYCMGIADTENYKGIGK